MEKTIAIENVKEIENATEIIELSNDYEKAKDYALNLLSKRDYSGAELILKLSKYYEEETCAAVLERVREIGCQDDSVYAEKLANYLVEKKYYGIRRVKFEMRHKGLSAEDIEAAILKYDDEKIAKKITEHIRRRYWDLLAERKERNSFKKIKKVTDALARRGYEYDDIKAGIQRVCDDIEID